VTEQDDLVLDVLRAEREREELPAPSVDEAWGAFRARAAVAPRPLLPRLRRLGAALALFGGGVAVGTQLPRRSDVRPATPSLEVPSVMATVASPPLSVSVASSAATASSAPFASSAPERSAAPPRRAVPPQAAPSASASSARVESALVDEQALVEAARTAHLRGRPEETLLLARRHAERFPGGALREERDFLLVSALRDLGRTEEARAAARLFLRDYPRSGFRRDVESVLGP
jgi:hypothetical protein